MSSHTECKGCFGGTRQAVLIQLCKTHAVKICAYCKCDIDGGSHILCVEKMYEEIRVKQAAQSEAMRAFRREGNILSVIGALVVGLVVVFAIIGLLNYHPTPPPSSGTSYSCNQPGWMEQQIADCVDHQEAGMEGGDGGYNPNDDIAP